jgi:hypothetical protein
LDTFRSEYGPVTVPCKYDTEVCSFIKRAEVAQRQGNYWLVERESTPRSSARATVYRQECERHMTER